MTVPPSSGSPASTPPPPPGGGTSARLIRLDDLTKQEFPLRAIKERASFLQKTGRTLFFWVLFATMAVLTVAFVFLFKQTPSLESRVAAADTVTATLDTVSVRLLAEQQAAAFGRFIQIVEKLIVAVFLPLLTAILGYLFGTRVESPSPDEDQG